MGTTTVPCHETSTVPCLGTFASALPGHVCSPCLGRLPFPAWERLPVPCLGMLDSVHALPGHACSPCLGRLPVPAWERLPVPCLRTFASALPGHVLQSLLAMLCQFPAWGGLCVRTSFSCEAIELFRIALDGKLAAWKKKELQLLCKKSLVPESHDMTQRECSMARIDHDLSHERNVLRVRAVMYSLSR